MISACARDASTDSQNGTTGDEIPSNDAMAAEIATLNAKNTQLANDGFGGGVEAGADATFIAAGGSPTPFVITATPTPQPSPTPGPTADLSVPQTYEVKKGDFVFCVARRFNVDAIELLGANGINREQVISAGLVLSIPTNLSPFPGDRALQAHPTTYTIQAEDTLNSIACIFGDVFPDDIAQLNNLDPNTELTVGNVINIP